MPLETATYINELNAANPLGSDPIASGDDHLRLIKSSVKATFPNITGPVTVTQAQINTGVPLANTAVQPAALTAAQATLNASIAAVDAAKADKTITVSAGTGLTGGGSLASNRTLTLANTAVTPGSYGSATKLARVTVDAQGRITAAQEFDLPVVKGLGLGGEVWNNVTGSRAFGQTYTNSRGYPIMISATSNASGSSGLTINVNGAEVYFNQAQWNGAGAFGGGTMIVPPGATYSVTASSSLRTWWELY